MITLLKGVLAFFEYEPYEELKHFVELHLHVKHTEAHHHILYLPTYHIVF